MKRQATILSLLLIAIVFSVATPATPEEDHVLRFGAGSGIIDLNVQFEEHCWDIGIATRFSARMSYEILVRGWISQEIAYVHDQRTQIEVTLVDEIGEENMSDETYAQVYQTDWLSGDVLYVSPECEYPCEHNGKYILCAKRIDEWILNETEFNVIVLGQIAYDNPMPDEDVVFVAVEQLY